MAATTLSSQGACSAPARRRLIRRSETGGGKDQIFKRTRSKTTPKLPRSRTASSHKNEVDSVSAEDVRAHVHLRPGKREKPNEVLPRTSPSLEGRALAGDRSPITDSSAPVEGRGEETIKPGGLIRRSYNLRGRQDAGSKLALRPKETSRA
jgi:hypothetical protein